MSKIFDDRPLTAVKMGLHTFWTLTLEIKNLRNICLHRSAMICVLSSPCYESGRAERDFFIIIHINLIIRKQYR